MAAVLFADKTLLNQFVNFDRAQAASGDGAILRDAQHFGFRFLLAWGAAVVVFGYVRDGHALRTAAESVRAAPLRLGGFVAHAVFLSGLIPLSALLYPDGASPLPFGAVVTLWLLAALAATGCAVSALAPWPVWRACVQAVGNIWAYAFLAALAGAGAMQVSQSLWEPTAAVTFDLVHRLLLPFIPHLSADPATRILSTDRFAVQISETCSGLEGMGLVLAFTTAWLIYFRREYIFPRALVLIPLGLLAIFILNILRIAGLMLIGHAGFPETAVFGFHSQAGWIAFNSVACGMAFLSRRSAWMNREASAHSISTPTENPTAVFLLPILAILAAGALSHAMSGIFEFFYPLRMLAAAIALVYLRRSLTSLSWGWSWRGPAVGLAGFALWMLGARYVLHPAPMPLGLRKLSPTAQDLWIACRVTAAVVTVPLAEELAYRGYLMRRLMEPHFERVAFTSVRWPAVVLTAVIFGSAHGSMWLPATVVGAFHGFLSVRSGALGEAIAAHATTNLLIAATVLLAGRWELW